MKNDTSKRFHWRLLTNVVYSAIISCLIEVFLVTNINMVLGYLGGVGYLVGIRRTSVALILAYVLIGIIIFTISFLLLQEKSMRYIGDISTAMQNISEGDLNTVVEVMGDDEFSTMAVNLNKMVEDIKVLIDKERESERTKNELVTNVAHDLRTPLTSIIGYLELLSGDTPMTPEMQKKYLNIAFAKSKRLEKLIEDLFGFTKLNCGKIAMNVGNVDIVKLLSQLLEEFYPNFTEKNLSCEFNSNVPAKTIKADGNLMARLFDNLIGNAIKYGADGKRILVTMDAGEELVTICIVNYGYVIPEAELPMIFDKFYRVEQSRSTDTGGTGLGLAIAKNIVEMHGGSIEAESSLKGTVFKVRLQVHFDADKEHFGTLGG